MHCWCTTCPWYTLSGVFLHKSDSIIEECAVYLGNYCLPKKPSCSIQKNFHCEYLRFTIHSFWLFFFFSFGIFFCCCSLFLLLFFFKEKIKTIIMFPFSLSSIFLSCSEIFPSKFNLLDFPFLYFSKMWKIKVGRIQVHIFIAWRLHSKKQANKFAFMYSSFSLDTVLE